MKGRRDCPGPAGQQVGRRRPLGSDGSWWKVAGGGIGRGAEPGPLGQTGQVGRAGPAAAAATVEEPRMGWASPGGFNAQGRHSRGKRMV